MAKRAQDDDVVMSLVESALARPAEEREAYLESACAGDPELHQRVSNYVQWELRMNGFLLAPLHIPDTVEHPFEPGELLDRRFRIVREVARGGMGVVYEATDQKLERRVALKCAIAGFGKRLPPEVRNATAISHPNVCKTFEIHTADTRFGKIDFLTMEFLDGETLAERLARGPAAESEAATIARQLCAGLAEAHRNKVIHGDLKSNNVILTCDADGMIRAVITDFGLARAPESALRAAQSGVRGGTPDYMAPELFRGERASVATDIYALGVVLHVMLTGHPPRRVSSEFGAERREVANLSPPWQRVIVRCLESRPEDRFANVEAVWGALERRHRVTQWLVAAMAVLMIALAVMLWRSRDKPLSPIQLAVLPLSVDGDRLESAARIGLEVADRLVGARRQFTVLSPREAERNQAVTPERAHTSLGATHVLETHVRSSGGTMTANASVVDLQSGRTMGQLQGTYSTTDSAVLVKALVGTVTEALRLPRRAPKESMEAAAYPDYLKAIDLLRQDNARNADEAIALLMRVVEIDPRSALPYAGIAEAQIQKLDRGDGSQWLDRAEATVAKAVSINPDAVPVLLVSSEVDRRHGRYEAALHQLARATEIAPEDPETWRRLAYCYEQANRPEEALATYQKAIQAQPNYYRHHLDFGSFYWHRGQFERAETQYRRVVDIAPNLASGHMNLGLALVQEGRFSEAEQQLLAALNLRRSPNLLLNIGALYYEEERFEEAAQYFQLSLAAGVTVPMQYRNLGDANRHLGRLKDTRDAYSQGRKLVEQEITRNPRRAESHVLLGYFSAFLGDRQRADFEISQALAIEPESATVMRDAAIAYESMGQREEALGVLRKAPRRLLEELNRQPDVKELRQDSAFRSLLMNVPAQ